MERAGRLMKAYNGSSTGWNETKTRKEGKGSNRQMETGSYRNNPTPTSFMSNNISYVGRDTHVINMITKSTVTTDEPRSSTIKGELFLIVSVTGKNGTSVGTSHLNLRLTSSGKIPRCQTSVVIHVRLKERLGRAS